MEVVNNNNLADYFSRFIAYQVNLVAIGCPLAFPKGKYCYSCKKRELQEELAHFVLFVIFFPEKLTNKHYQRLGVQFNSG